MRKLKLSHRIFMSMLVLIFFSFLAVGVTTIFRYQSKNKEYHKERLKRKDRAVVQSIKHMTNPKELSLEKQYKETDILQKLSSIHKLNINIYDLGGLFIAGSDTNHLDHNNLNKELVNTIIKKLNRQEKTVREIQDKKEFLQIYTVLYDNKNPYAILNIPYNSSELNNINEDIKNEVLVLVKIYTFLFMLSGLIAVFLLKQITRPLKIVTQKLKDVEITKKNQPIFWPVKDELGMLISQYNNLIKELKEKAEKLAKSERQSAWKKMAQQIAHEIKNPLTPMRLSVQHFEKTITKNDKELNKKVKEFTSTMIQQIDTMSAVASAFSNFASLTKEVLEEFPLEEEIEKITDLYKKEGIRFKSENQGCYVKMDKTHLTRILNNLIQNAIQSIPDTKEKKITLKIDDNLKFWSIQIKDNGMGIKEEIRNKIFEPNFTTKNSGMGLGLAMVKNIINDFGGEISFITKLGLGTTFFVQIPKFNQKQ